jgi:hypothetical protein
MRLPWITGFNAWYLLRTAAMISESTMKDSITVTHKLEKLFCDRSYQAGINTSSTSSQDLPSAKYRLHSSSSAYLS